MEYKIMERKIGEIFEFGGEWYQCCRDENDKCKGCSFLSDKGCYVRDKRDEVGVCGKLRSDGNSVIFKKLEKVGKPINIEGRTFQCFNSFCIECIGCAFFNSKHDCDKNLYIDYSNCLDKQIWIEIKQNKEDMKDMKDMEKKKDIEILEEYLEKTPIKRILADAVYLKKLKEARRNPPLEFNLEAAKAGKPVCTRDGRKARIICFDRNWGEYKIISLITENNGDELIASYGMDGKEKEGNSNLDLMMLPKKEKEKWVNIYKDADVFGSEEDARRIASDDERYVATVRIE